MLLATHIPKNEVWQLTPKDSVTTIETFEEVSLTIKITIVRVVYVQERIVIMLYSVKSILCALTEIKLDVSLLIDTGSV